MASINRTQIGHSGQPGSRQSASSDASLFVLQHNLGKGKVATAELRQEAQNRRASILLIQEPWTVRNVVCGIGTLSNREALKVKSK